MRSFLGASLKDNDFLDSAILTGILRVSKESLFSDLNNIEIYSLLDTPYGEYFGFTESEVVQLLEKSNHSDSLPAVRQWYNGYQCGSVTIYNPWSIIHFITRGVLSAYWVNTGGNALIKEQIVKSNVDFQESFEALLQGVPITKWITDQMAFGQLTDNPSAIWTLLLMAGYLKVTAIKKTGTHSLCDLEIPNDEVRNLYEMLIKEWLSCVNDVMVFNEFLDNLLKGHIQDFTQHLKRIMLVTFSTHDIKGDEPEKFFHGFMLGLLAGVDQTDYAIDSNKEAGLGRYDILIAPRKDSTRLGIIIEVKSIKDENTSQETLVTMANQALAQIDRKKYKHAILLQPNQPLLNIGICFNGKELSMASTRSVV
jgi:hypothetical protein